MKYYLATKIDIIKIHLTIWATTEKASFLSTVILLLSYICTDLSCVVMEGFSFFSFMYL